jgi:hypothetical protein
MQERLNSLPEQIEIDVMEECVDEKKFYSELLEVHKIYSYLSYNTSLDLTPLRIRIQTLERIFNGEIDIKKYIELKGYEAGSYDSLHDGIENIVSGELRNKL